jgi:hypothetical protein
MTRAERSALYNIEKTGEDAYRLTMAVGPLRVEVERV